MTLPLGNEPAVFAFGPFVLDRDRRLLARDGAAVSVTPKAFDLLVTLVERGGAPLSKEELMTRLWPDTAVEESNLAFQISTLRKALGADGARFIATLPGRGYQFVAPLQRVETPAVVENAIVENERSEITVPERRRPKWIWAAALALVVLGAIAATIVLSAKSQPAIRSVAVLPFKPLAAERDEALELGMADTLITRLSRMPGVVVRPISAVRRYSQLDQDALAAGRALGVDAVVDGSIQRHGTRMRVTVRLLRTSDGTPVWATHFDDDAQDLFAAQDLVAERVARAITRSAETLPQRPTNDLQAYELYLKGRYWAYSDPARADAFFRRAVARDPRFAAAWAAIAGTWLARGRYGNVSPREQFDKAREAALKAVALDPGIAEAHAALGQVYADHDWDWKRAEEEFRRALELNPNSDVAHGQYAYLLTLRRDFDGALEHSARAIEIDPLSAMSAVVHGWILDCAGQSDAAIAHLEETLRLHPRLVPALLHLGIIYATAGEPDLALNRLDQALAIQPGNTQLLSLKAYAHAKAGRRDQALTLIRDLETTDHAPAPNLALAWTALGNHDRAFHWLDRAYEERLYLLRVIAAKPGYAPLRGDPRYAELMGKMGL
ncbi:MAG TPA: tetratricopeptide repeat protein [Thermoanaerobaculia bacterium]|jgi:DNA-binding winged helix-turn-helix (wHTH) protein/TolB-like protein/Tfp pilus assembly protein PilF